MPTINRNYKVSDERVEEILRHALPVIEASGFKVPSVPEARDVLTTDWTEAEETQDYLDEAPAEEIADWFNSIWAEIQQGRWKKVIHDDGDRFIYNDYADRTT